MENTNTLTNSLANAVAKMDLKTLQLISFFELCPLYAKEGTGFIFDIIKKSGKFDRLDLAKAMHSPTVIRCEYFLYIIKAKLAKIPRKDKLMIYDFFSSLLNAWCIEDPYAYGEKNMIHKKDEIESIIPLLKTAVPETAKAIGKLVHSCYHLSHSLYTDTNPQVSYENYGPYDVSKHFGDNHILVIREFKNLKPAELWGKEIETIPCNKITIYTVYKNVEFTINAISHSIFNGDLINGLAYSHVEIDSKETNNLEEINIFSKKIAENAAYFWTLLKEMDFESLKRKYLEARHYNMVNLCKLIGMNWRPTEDILKAVKGKELKKDFFPVPEDKEEQLRYWKLLLDPEAD